MRRSTMLGLSRKNDPVAIGGSGQLEHMVEVTVLGMSDGIRAIAAPREAPATKVESQRWDDDGGRSSLISPASPDVVSPS